MKRLTLFLLIASLDGSAQTVPPAEPQKPWTIIINGKEEVIDQSVIDEALANVHIEMGLDMCEKMLTLAREYNDPEVEAQALNCIGKEYTTRARFDEALEVFEQALAMNVFDRRKAGIAAGYHNIGNVYLEMGKYDEALSYFEKARTANRLDGRKGEEAANVNAIGTVHVRMGDYAGAIRAFEESLANRGDDVEGKAATLSNLAAVHHALDNYPRAIELNEQALQLIEKKFDFERKAAILNNLATIDLERREFARGLERGLEAVALARKVGDPASESIYLFNVAKLHLGRGDRDAATQALKEARTAAAKGSNRIVPPLIDAIEGVMLLNAGKPADALPLLQRSRSALEAAGVVDQVSELWKGVAAAAVATGQTDLAVSALENSIRFAEEVRRKAETPELRGPLFESKVDAYRALASLLIKKGDHVRAFDVSERGRGRVMLDELSGHRTALIGGDEAKRALLDDIRRTEDRTRANDADIAAAARVELVKKRAAYAELVTKHRAVAAAGTGMAAPMRLRDVQSALDSATTLISYWIADESVYAFVVRKERFRAISLAVTPTQLREQVTLFRDFSLLDESVPPQLQKLYDELWKPLAADVEGKRLLIVPAGVLHYLPFAALHDGANYLGDRFAISYLPSASAINLAAPTAKGTSVVAAAVSRPAGAGRLLPYAVAAATEAAAAFAVAPLIDSAATETAVKEKLSGVRVALFAAHAELNAEQPLFSRIQLAPSTLDDGFLHLHEIREMTIPAEVVVLSACNTQIGQVSEGDEVAALNRAFLTAGTRAVIATLWSVKDEASAALVTTLFRALRAGKPPEVALQEAQRSVRKDWPHPYYWAGFVSTGAGAMKQP